MGFIWGKDKDEAVFEIRKNGRCADLFFWSPEWESFMNRDCFLGNSTRDLILSKHTYFDHFLKSLSAKDVKKQLYWKSLTVDEWFMKCVSGEVFVNLWADGVAAAANDIDGIK